MSQGKRQSATMPAAAGSASGVLGDPSRYRRSTDSASDEEDARVGARARDSRDIQRLLHSSTTRRKGKGKAAKKSGVREGEVLYQMEEGGPHSRSPSSSSSSQSSLSDYGFAEKLPQASSSRRRRCCGYAALHVTIAALFVVIALGAYRATRSTRPQRDLSPDQMLSNGTSLFAPTTVLISLDGFRADYIERGLSPTLQSFIMDGVSPEYMLPSFPSVTFPNHFTLATGLYPESHGIVGNSFYDPALGESFYYTDPSHSMQPKWWLGEPFWETAEAQGLATAIHMWPGSEAHIGRYEPTYVDKFNGSEVLDVKVARVLELLDKAGPLDAGSDPAEPRPQLIAAYVPNVDANGHLYGPNSTEVDASISDVDNLLHGILAGLEARNLTDIVNIVVVSDHGMASTSESRVIQLENLIDTSKVAHFDGWPHFGLRPHDDADIQSLYEALLEAQKTQEGFDVYLRDQNMPERWHFSNNERIAPLWIFPHTGWAIAPKQEFDVTDAGAVYHPKGIHGYDHEHPLMRAIFVARGPAFPHPAGARLDPFQNIEVYNILCDSISIEPRPNNGTLRLPLKPVGNHLDQLQNDSPVASDTSGQTSTAIEESLTTATDVPPPPRPTIDRQGVKDQVVNTAKHWWEWVTDKASGVGDWVSDKAQGVGDWVQGVTNKGSDADASDANGT